jgi:NAD(P)H-quinone oxidoreductase subunit I
VCIFCANCVEFCPTNCLSVTEDYELAAYDRHDLNYHQVAMGRLPSKVTEDPMVTPLREFAYLPKGVIDPPRLACWIPAGWQTTGGDSGGNESGQSC